jgi:hypothetical protein
MLIFSKSEDFKIRLTPILNSFKTLLSNITLKLGLIEELPLSVKNFCLDSESNLSIYQFINLSSSASTKFIIFWRRKRVRLTLTGMSNINLSRLTLKFCFFSPQEWKREKISSFKDRGEVTVPISFFPTNGTCEDTYPRGVRMC